MPIFFATEICGAETGTVLIRLGVRIDPAFFIKMFVNEIHCLAAKSAFSQNKTPYTYQISYPSQHHNDINLYI